MERRKAIKNIGLSIGAVVATPSMVGLLQSCQAQEEPWIPTFYTEEQGTFIKKLIDTLLPPSGDLPGAIDVNVHVFVDKFVQEVISVDDKPGHRSMLSRSMNALLQLAGKETMGEVGADAYETFLESHLKKSKEEDEALLESVYAYLGENPDDFNGLEEKGSIYLFLTQLRDMSIWAYRNSEVVGETVMAYVSVPGKQEGCVDLQETTGGKAWSLTW